MVNFIVVAVLVVVGGFFLYNSKTDDGWDFKKGLAAFVVLAGAVGTWFTDFGTTITGLFN